MATSQLIPYSRTSDISIVCPHRVGLDGSTKRTGRATASPEGFDRSPAPLAAASAVEAALLPPLGVSSPRMQVAPHREG